MTTTSSPPDWRGLCEELVDEWDAVADQDLGPMADAVDRARALLSQPEPEVVGPTNQELTQLLFEGFRGPIEFICDAEEEAHLMIRNHVRFARAVLARYGRPAPAPAGERQAAPVPVAADVYFEFVVSDADYCTQAGGIAPSYAQAVSEGQNYMAQYQQDGLHTLELRRVEVLPLPSGEDVEP